MKNNCNSVRGFSLVELLVAMAVFISLMAGIMVLFTGAVNTVRGSYQLLDAYEVGRTAVDRIDADLKGAFTSREHGDFYNFYGTPFGFMYVGTLENGALGRVTYALHPNAETVRFDTTIMESWAEVRENVVDSLEAQGIDRLVAGRQFQSVYPDPDGVFTAPYSEEVVEFPVSVDTYSLVRFEEQGVTDLNTFQLPGGVQWPYIDPVDPGSDVVPPSDVPSFTLYAELLSAINPDPALGANSDLRNIIKQSRGGNNQPFLQGITTQTVVEILAAKKREIWIRIVGGERVGNMPPAWYNDNTPQNAIPVPDPFGWPRNASEYVLADGIMRRALLLDPGSGGSLGGPQVVVEAVYVPGIFGYGDGDRNFSSFFNSPYNIRGKARFNNDHVEMDYGKWLSMDFADSNGFDLLGHTILLDRAIVDAQTRDRRSQEALGSPLLPRLPAIVVVDFSISREKTRPGVGDFRRKFAQMIDIPTAISGGEMKANAVSAP